jgi:hypothetical protein
MRNYQSDAFQLGTKIWALPASAGFLSPVEFPPETGDEEYEYEATMPAGTRRSSITANVPLADSVSVIPVGSEMS